ncbi:MAG: spore coat U domain-containing protein [Erythrobacter sp.]|jgi:spore coat protein U-like protein
MKTHLLRAGMLASAASIAAASPAMANSSTAQFEVRLQIQAACSVVAGAASDIDLGAQASTATALSGNSDITVNCSRNTPYFIGLLPSNANANGAGIMTAAGSADDVPYQLRSAAGTSGTIWGNTASSSGVGNGVAGVGIGADQTIPVYVTVDSANFTPASYSDIVTVAVNF